MKWGEKNRQRNGRFLIVYSLRRFKVSYIRNTRGATTLALVYTIEMSFDKNGIY